MANKMNKEYEVNRFGEIAVKAYRILEGKVISNKMANEEQHVELQFNNVRPLYASSNFEEAKKMFERLCKEGYRKHMLFVADYGVLDLKTAIKCRLNGASAWSDNYKDKAPMLTIAEYSNDTSDWLDDVSWNMGSIIEIMTRGLTRSFNDIPEALVQIDKLRRLSAPFTVNMITDIHDGNTGKMFTRKRTLVTNRWLQEGIAANRYVGCKKIRNFRSCEKVVAEAAGYNSDLMNLNSSEDDEDDWVE